MTTNKAKLLATLFLCTGYAFSGYSYAAPLCDPLALGLQVHVAAQYDDGGCVINSSSTTPVVNSASYSNSSAYATTSYGVNKASISGFLTEAGGVTNASAWSIWADTITITGGTGSDIVNLGAHLSGSYSLHTDVNYTLAVNGGAFGNFTGFSSRYFDAQDPDFSYDVGLNYTFTYDVPFTLTSWLDLYGYLNSTYCCGETTFDADFTHTVLFNSVTLPSGAILHTGSGVNYPVGASVAETPEPSTLLLLATGFIGLAATRRRKL